MESQSEVGVRHGEEQSCSQGGSVMESVTLLPDAPLQGGTHGQRVSAALTRIPQPEDIQEERGHLLAGLRLQGDARRLPMGIEGVGDAQGREHQEKDRDGGDGRHRTHPPPDEEAEPIERPVGTSRDGKPVEVVPQILREFTDATVPPLGVLSQRGEQDQADVARKLLPESVQRGVSKRRQLVRRGLSRDTLAVQVGRNRLFENPMRRRR